MILIEQNLFNKDICDSLIRLTDLNKENAEAFRDINLIHLVNYDQTFAKKLINFITNFLGSRGVTAYPETIQITIWKENSKQDMHFDITRESTNLTSITYLNEDYLGGETVFDNGIVIRPEIGKTVFFDGKKYLHGVNPIIQGTRYVLAIWYTSDLESIIM